ncbi:MAG: septum formation inhibitor Maf [Proteobacteria bacterium]|jgi:septum formation protein|nr:septum formation inhibitor Maf [Pseudomonadota bacterium]MBS1173009.1 septum formation inhibitor Maf [Pseudomonadota bacterium]
MSSSPPLVLASTSPYRRELLQRLGIRFETASPGVDESALPGETPVATSERLALAKARAVAHDFPDALIIGSDQVAYADGRVFGKPGVRDRAVEQLQTLRGRSVLFHTALCLLNSRTDHVQLEGVPIEVRFRDLSDDEIERYLDRESALNCAGSARCEGLGISLLEYIRGDDPNALIGLPLIALCRMLRCEGLAVP